MFGFGKLSGRGSVLLAGSTALVVALTVAPASAATVAGSSAAVLASPPAAAAAAVDWRACRDGFQCASIPVPLDYDGPAGEKINLSVIRLPAASPGSKIGSLLLNPGGPGGSGVDIARGIAPYLPLELRARFDIVGFDPRGIARSTPLRCYDTSEEAYADLPAHVFPVTSAEEQAQRAADAKLVAACGRHGGPILEHMSTADVARDMDRLRALFGDSKLNYLGFSYGSVLGQTYANMFPNRVRALVIDAVVDPVAWSTGARNEGRVLPFSTRLRSDVGAQSTLNEFFRLCDAAAVECAFSGASAARFAALAEQLRRHPIEEVDPTDPEAEPARFTYADLIGITLGALYSPAVWPDLGEVLAGIEAEASAEVIGERLATLRAGLGLAEGEQEPYPNEIEGGPGVACSDSVNPDAFDAWPRAADAAERHHGYFGRLWTWAWAACRTWPEKAAEDSYTGPWTRRTANPVLVVGNYFDPATRYQGAVTASRLLPNSRLLSYAGWGHAAFIIAAHFCVNQAVTRYLITTRTPPAGKVCRPEGSPFGPTEAAMSAAASRGGAAAVAAVLPSSVRRAFGRPGARD